jgi:predicted nucleic acid-binding protein
VTLLPLDDAVLDTASELDPTTLRSLDALHLATALHTDDDVEIFVTCDRRLGSAAEAHGLGVALPELAPV